VNCEPTTPSSALSSPGIPYSTRSFSGLRLLVIPFMVVAVLTSALLFSGAAGPDDRFQKRLNLSQDPERLLQQILSRKEFQQGAEESVFDRLKKRLDELIARALEWVFGRIAEVVPREADLGFLGTTLAVLVLGVIGIALLFLAKRLIEMIVGRQTGAKARRDGFWTREHPSVRSEAVREDALKLAAAGNYRQALLRLFWFALLWLDERDRLLLRPGKTNREILESLPPDEPCRKSLARMVPSFNRVRFGNAPCGREDYELFLDLCRQITEGR